MTDKNKESDGQKGPGVSVLFQETKVRTVHPGIHILGGMGNSLAIETERGFVQIDTGMNGGMAAGFLESLRTISDAPVHTIVYSHGHNGYNNGTRRFLEDALQQGNPAPQIVAHERLPNRYRRFEETWQLQNHLAAMQFRMSAEGMRKPKYVYPTVTFGDMLRLNMGDRMVEILWAPSETDDAVAVWLPEEKVLYGGPSVIASCINVGTPLRTQRDAVRWADTLDRLSALRPEVLIPSFGKTLKGTDEIQSMLGNMADGLRYLRREVLERLNRGLSDVEIVHDMDYPAEYFEQPWSAPIYGCPDMIVRDIYRSENGWWDRNPTNLHPAPPDRAATSVLEAIGDRQAVLNKARSLRDAGEVQLALHVIDLLARAPGDDPDVLEAKRLKSELLHLRSKDVPSIVSTNLYLSCADQIDREIQEK